MQTTLSRQARDELDDLEPHVLLEYLASRAPALASGERKLVVVFSNGRYRRGFLDQGPLSPGEFDDLFGT